MYEYYLWVGINYLADDFIVEVVDVHPLDALIAVLLLLPLQHQLNE